MIEFFRELINFFRPKAYSCYACEKEVFDGDFLCPECRNSFPVNERAICSKCGREQVEEGICLHCKEHMPRYELARSCFSHTGGARRIILRAKTGERHRLDFLVLSLYAVYQRYYANIRFDGIAYVPLYPRDRKIRGFSLCRDLAEALAKKVNLPVCHALKKVKPTPYQKSLSAEDREKNLRGCFCSDDSVKGMALLVVDDVMTTGATANEITNTLKKKGARAVYFITVTSSPMREEEQARFDEEKFR